MKITEDVRPACCGTAEQGIAEEEALKRGMFNDTDAERFPFCRILLLHSPGQPLICAA
jgi:hypothetical protein